MKHLNDKIYRLLVKFDLKRSVIDRILFRTPKTEIKFVVFKPLYRQYNDAKRIIDLINNKLPKQFKIALQSSGSFSVGDVKLNEKCVAEIIAIAMEKKGKPELEVTKSIIKNFTIEEMAAGLIYAYKQAKSAEFNRFKPIDLSDLRRFKSKSIQKAIEESKNMFKNAKQAQTDNFFSRTLKEMQQDNDLINDFKTKYQSKSDVWH